MNTRRHSDSSPQFILGLFMVLSLLILALFGGCASTVVPDPIPISDTAAFDGSEQNAGIVAVLEDGNFLVTPRVRVRYNTLIEEYGDRFLPVLIKDTGIILRPGIDGYVMTPEAMANYATMVQWRRMGRAPQ